MILNEIFGKQTIMEYGKHEFPGFRQRLFSKQHYEYVVSKIADVPDDTLRADLGSWFCEAFGRDSYEFKEGRFMDWVRQNKRGGRGYATFQQRHFYYFAHLIKSEHDENRREFLTDWLGELFRACNPAFKPERWAKFCKPDLEPEAEPLNEGPAYGSRGFPGFSMNLFGPVHRAAIGEELADIGDPVVKEDTAKWFAEAFTRDCPSNPGMPPKFDGAGYVAAVLAGGPFRAGSPRFQMRHYYYLAELIKREADIHKRIFICHFLTPIFEANNEHFMPSRWEDFCDIPAEHRDWKPENKKKGLDRTERSERVNDEEDFA